MKTKEQVQNWLKNKDWFEKFKTNVEKHISLDEFLDKYSVSFLIVAAFPWIDTPEGEDFWYEKHNNFLEWFCNEND